MAARVLLRHRGSRSCEFPAQFLQPCAGDRTDRHHGRAFQKGARHQFLHLELHQSHQVRVYQVGLGQRDDAARNPQQAADVEVLTRLRFDGFIGGNNEQHQVDPAHPGQHVLDEALVARHVHKPQPQGRAELQVRKAQIDGDPATLFLFQAIGIDARERFHERGLAVIDMAGGADNDVLH